MTQDETNPREVVFTSWEEAVGAGIQLQRGGNPASAEEIYRQVLFHHPDQPDALHFLGVARHQRGDSEEAVELIRRAVAVNPGYVEAHGNLGNVLKELGRFEEAVDAYRVTLGLKPDFADAHNNLGVAYRCVGRLDEAEASYRRAIALDPKHIDAHQNLGNVLKRRGRLDEAEAHYRIAIMLDPHHPAARPMLGAALTSAGKVEAAAAVFREWVDQEPHNPVAAHLLAATTGRDTPARASDGFVEMLFDRFAASFDEQLADLEYRAPDLVAEAVVRELGAGKGDCRVLDAGCGTGLCGPHLRPYGKDLVGVDLSAGMLRRAARLGVYDELIQEELVGHLRSTPGEWDLIVSADTLCYFGDLASVLGAARRALRPTGVLVFTVEFAPETSAPGGFVLHPHGRYAHSEGYVIETLGAQGLAVGPVGRDTLRLETEHPVTGLVVVARRGPS